MQVFAMAEALHDNKHVTCLDLSYNNIDDAGVSTLSRLLKFNKCIRELDLEGNNISPEGAKKLSETISEEDGVTAGTKCPGLDSTSGRSQYAISLRIFYDSSLHQQQ